MFVDEKQNYTFVPPRPQIEIPEDIRILYRAIDLLQNVGWVRDMYECRPDALSHQGFCLRGAVHIASGSPTAGIVTFARSDMEDISRALGRVNSVLWHRNINIGIENWNDVVCKNAQDAVNLLYDAVDLEMK